MKQALIAAENALREGEVPVGCVIVHNPTQQIIGTGWNKTVEKRNGTRHAEMEAFDQILASSNLTTIDLDKKENNHHHDELSIFSDCTLYVTVEPCIMCASALLLMRIGRVYCGCMNDKFGGCGSIVSVHEHDNTVVGVSDDDNKDHDGPRNRNSLQFSRYQCVSGLFADEAIQLLKRFYEQENPLAPKPQRKKRKTTLTTNEIGSNSSSGDNSGSEQVAPLTIAEEKK